MAIGMKTFTAALIAAALMVPQVVDAKNPKRGGAKRPVTISQPKNVREAGKKDRTHTSRKQMVAMAKAAKKRGKATLKTARKDLAAVQRSELRNRNDRATAKDVYNRAKLAAESNPTPANINRSNAALAAYLPVRDRHLSSVAALTSQRNRVTQLENLQKQALNATTQARGMTPSAPRAGAPRFGARPANFVRPVEAYDRVAAPQQIYGPGPVQRVDSVAASARIVQNASQSLVREFNQQQAQRQALAANGQFVGGANNQVYQRAQPVAQNAYQAANDAMFF
ncbi:MAG: hypothetical protein AAF127_10845 [Pseudomonadota bacterium]